VTDSARVIVKPNFAKWSISVIGFHSTDVELDPDTRHLLHPQFFFKSRLS
jgi:hypothetical protein